MRRPDEKPWSEIELFDLRNAIRRGETIEEVAAFLGREDSVDEVVRRAEEMGLKRRRN